ncbi:MAG: DUF2752 domain-containing protein [Pirellulaceae bacterium]
MALQMAGINARADDRFHRNHRKLYDVFFSPFATAFAVVALVLSMFLPSDGLGITVCLFKSLYGLPCPGCGLTRSVTCISHLQFAKAWDYHPFGMLVYALFVANVVLIVVPKAGRESLKGWMAVNEPWLKPVYLAMVLSFLTFGCFRILFYCSWK